MSRPRKDPSEYLYRVNAGLTKAELKVVERLGITLPKRWRAEWPNPPVPHRSPARGLERALRILMEHPEILEEAVVRFTFEYEALGRKFKQQVEKREATLHRWAKAVADFDEFD
jgi:hypothetical protein